MSVGTYGWRTMKALSGSRLGLDERHTIKVIVRDSGPHEGYVSIWEYNAEFPDNEWRIVSWDHKRRLLGETLGHTKDAARRKMNAVYAAKNLGVFSHHAND